MAKPEWGSKRICTNCQARFYDLKKNPIECPHCGTQFDPSVFAKPKRNRPPAAAKPAPVKPVAKVEPKVEAKEAPAEGAADEAADETLDDDEDEAVLEDASDLGEDEDDVAEVLENVDERKEE